MPTRVHPLPTVVALVLTLAAGADAGQAAPSPAADTTQTAASAPATISEAATAAARSTEPDTSAQPAPQPEAARFPLSGGATFDFMSHYLWRGFVLTDTFSFQPGVWAKIGDFTVSSWTSWAEGQDGGPLMEHDLTVDYSKSVGQATLSVGYINYLFPAVDEGSVSNEIYVASAFAVPLNPTVKVFFDVHEGSGTYLNFGVSHAIPLTSTISLTPGFAIGYNHEQWIDESAWNDANFSLKLAVPINGHITLGPALYYSKGLNDAIPDKFYGGLSVATTF